MRQKVQQTLTQWQKQAQQQLVAISPTADIEARLCLCHVLNVSNSYLYSYPERELSSTELAQLTELLSARLSGQPLAYLFGYWHFFDLQLEVAPSTLIPRPDTELLVEAALAQALDPATFLIDRQDQVRANRTNGCTQFAHLARAVDIAGKDDQAGYFWLAQQVTVFGGQPFTGDVHHQGALQADSHG